MSKILGVCVFTAAAVGVAVFAKKCMEAGCKDDVEYVDNFCKTKSLNKEVLDDHVNKAVRKIKSTLSDLCAHMRETTTAVPVIPEESPVVDNYDE